MTTSRRRLAESAQEQRLAALLPAVLRRVEQQHTALTAIRKRWTRLVGRPLAAHTHPASLRRGQLVIVAEQPGDGFALSFQREQLLTRIQALTKGKVTGLIIRPGEGVSHGVSH